MNVLNMSNSYHFVNIKKIHLYQTHNCILFTYEKDVINIKISYQIEIYIYKIIFIFFGCIMNTFFREFYLLVFFSDDSPLSLNKNTINF